MEKAITGLAYRGLHDITVEAMTLAALLARNTDIDKVEGILKPYHFYGEHTRRLYENMLLMYNKNGVIEMGALRRFFIVNSALFGGEVRALEFLKDITHSSSLLIKVENTAKIIVEYYILRALDYSCHAAIENINKLADTSRAYECTEDLEMLVTSLMSGSHNEPLDYDSKSMCVAQIIERIKTKGEPVNGVLTGFVSIDELLGGFPNSELNILAARPSMGKTALAINLAINIANNFRLGYEAGGVKKQVAFISLEMSAEQIMMRMISMQSGINMHMIRRGMITGDQLRHITQVSEEIGGLPLLIDDPSCITIVELRRKLRVLKRRENVACVFIDYLQLINGAGKTKNRVCEVSEITLGLKGMARELDIPIVVLSQLSRAVENREDKFPQLSDLRDSGSIEQDADVVMFLYRQAYYEQRKRPIDDAEKFNEWKKNMDRIINTADIIVAKNRNGSIGNVRLSFDSGTTCFSNCDTSRITENFN